MLYVCEETERMKKEAKQRVPVPAPHQSAAAWQSEQVSDGQIESKKRREGKQAMNRVDRLGHK